VSNTEHRTRQLHFGVNVLSDGAHPAAWQATESDPLAVLSRDHWIEIAQTVEAGKLDAMFLADGPALSQAERGPNNPLDPSILLATIGARTDFIGLVPTISSTFEEPFNLARRIASLDHLTAGRAGWNVVTTAGPLAAANFSARPHVEKAHRYARADEFVEVVLKLWTSWDPDALAGDKKRGLWADPGRINAIDHHGDHFDVVGPLNVPRSPQGRPVLVQAGGSPAGLNLAARYADAVFAWNPIIAGSAAYRADLHRRARALGRTPGVPLVLPGLGFTIGGTETEARARRTELDEIAGPRVLERLAGQIGVAPDDLDLDKPLPAALLDPDREPPGSRGMGSIALEIARSEQLTVRELLPRVMWHRNLVGAPEQIADNVEEWFLAGAVDGFNLMPDIGPSGIKAFVEHVVPILQHKGIFRSDYTGTTLREHLGLPKPLERFSAARASLAVQR
jgi:FMN-dependent oxidoreductase (nitrilotriacetate monooxygenase family)